MAAILPWFLYPTRPLCLPLYGCYHSWPGWQRSENAMAGECHGRWRRVVFCVCACARERRLWIRGRSAADALFRQISGAQVARASCRRHSLTWMWGCSQIQARCDRPCLVMKRVCRESEGSYLDCRPEGTYTAQSGSDSTAPVMER